MNGRRRSKQGAAFTFPSEHGAYIVLLASWLWGIIFSSEVNQVGVLLIFGITVCLFLAQESVRQMIRRRRFAVHPLPFSFSFLAIAFASILIIEAPQTLIIAIPVGGFALIYFLSARKGLGPYARSLIGFLLLSLITPATILTVKNFEYVPVVLSWLIVACFAVSSVLVVGIRLGQRSAVQRALAFHLLYAMVTFIIVWKGGPIAAIWIAGLAIARLLIVVAKCDSYRRMPLKTIGIIESLLTGMAVLLSAI